MDNYKDKTIEILSNDKLAYSMFFMLVISVSGGYIYFNQVDSEIIDNNIINSNEPNIQMNILETDNGIKVDVVQAGSNVDSILLEYNNDVKKIYNVTEDIKHNKGDGSYKIYYITESDELKLYDSYTRIQLKESEEYI